jgi:hypothetical protein
VEDPFDPIVDAGGQPTHHAFERVDDDIDQPNLMDRFRRWSRRFRGSLSVCPRIRSPHNSYDGENSPIYNPNRSGSVQTGLVNENFCAGPSTPTVQTHPIIVSAIIENEHRIPHSIPEVLVEPPSSFAVTTSVESVETITRMPPIGAPIAPPPPPPIRTISPSQVS